MKKNLFPLIVMLVSCAGLFTACSESDNPVIPEGTIVINSANFPDDILRNDLLESVYGQDGVLTEQEIMSIFQIDVHDMGIKSLKGIEFFTSVKNLDCSGNELEELNLSKNIALKGLKCQNNALTSLDVSNNPALTEFICNNNLLTSLDVSKNTVLYGIDCSNNLLTSLDFSNNTALQFLHCYMNQLTSINVSNNTELKYLFCNNNQLTSIDISNNTELQYLFCHMNQLTSIDISNNTELQWLSCYTNKLTSLDVSNNVALQLVYCHDNMISGANMDAFINSLPQNTSSDYYSFVVFDATAPSEGNVCTKAQVAAAKAKGWEAYYNDWKVYEGSE